jgi:hypothetical protein
VCFLRSFSKLSFHVFFWSSRWLLSFFWSSAFLNIRCIYFVGSYELQSLLNIYFIERIIFYWITLCFGMFRCQFVIFGSSINEGKNPYASPVRRNGNFSCLSLHFSNFLLFQMYFINIRAHGIGCAVVNIRTRDLVEGRVSFS